MSLRYGCLQSRYQCSVEWALMKRTLRASGAYLRMFLSTSSSSSYRTMCTQTHNAVINPCIQLRARLVANFISIREVFPLTMMNMEMRRTTMVMMVTAPMFV